MMLGFPEWVVYVAMVPPLALTAVIALYQAATGAEIPTKATHEPPGRSQGE